MNVKIRLMRLGMVKTPFYRIVISNSKSQRNGKIIENVGTYNPLLLQEYKKKTFLKTKRIYYWLSKGAIPTKKIQFILNKVKN